MADFKNGDRVRIIYEGTVSQFVCPGVFKFAGFAREHSTNFLDVVSVEVIEPEYEPGSVYEDADGEIWYRRFDVPSGPGQYTWTSVPSGERYYHGIPTRPLRKLVPEGENATTSQDA